VTGLAIVRDDQYDDDVEQHPRVVELRRSLEDRERALEVQRRALEYQTGVIQSLHSDGEAHTRRGDQGQGQGEGRAHRRTFDLMVPLIGVLVGALATYAGFSGRVATVEANVQALAAAQVFDRQKSDERANRTDDKIDNVVRVVSELVNLRKGERR
jgi:hypothetical protein